MDNDFITYDRDEENEFEQSADFGYYSRHEQYRREFEVYLEEWNNC